MAPVLVRSLMKKLCGFRVIPIVKHHGKLLTLAADSGLTAQLGGDFIVRADPSRRRPAPSVREPADSVRRWC